MGSEDCMRLTQDYLIQQGVIDVEEQKNMEEEQDVHRILGNNTMDS